MANLVGKTILGQFRIDAFVASGGMGAVYRVWDLKRNVPLAMKVLHAELAEDPSIFKRFEREGRALQKLAHPNIVPFYGIYQTADFPFLLERYIDGPTLKDILKSRGGPMALDEALVYLKALCAALGYAHANGVVHCDVKPGNVMVDRGGSIFLTDFGIARHAESTTTTIASAGTAAYMAPEQIRGSAVTPATDVYALGVILFEMLTGQRPFRGTERGTESGGETANERVRYGHLHLDAPDPRTLVPSMPDGLASAICTSLNKGSGDRYASAPEFFDAVCRAAGKNPAQIADHVSLPANIVSAQDATVVGAGAEAAVAPPVKRNWGAWIVASGLVVFGVAALGVAAAALLLKPGTSPVPNSTATPYPTFTPQPTFTDLPTYTPQPVPTSRPQPTSPPPRPTSPPPPPQPSHPDVGYGTVRVRDGLPNVVCHSGPGVNYGDVTTVHAGEEYAIVGYNERGWWKARSNRGDCWIASPMVSWFGDYSSAPITSE